MKEKQFSDLRTSRRTFFLKGLVTGIGVLLGFDMARGNPDEEGTIRLLNADGRLVEIPNFAKPPRTGKTLTNRELFFWKINHSARGPLPLSEALSKPDQSGKRSGL
jgi:hypothetical protein